MLKINKKIREAKEEYGKLVTEELKKINAFIKDGDVCVVERDGGVIKECGFFRGTILTEDSLGDIEGEVQISERVRNDGGAVVIDTYDISKIISITKYE